MAGPFLKRNPKLVMDTLVRKGNRITATVPVRMYFPTRWLERDLAVIENTITVLGYIALVDEKGNYAISKTPGMLRTEPSRITKEDIEGVSYTVFWYNKGASVISMTEVVKLDTLVHAIYTELIGGGHIPAYFDYNDLVTIFRDIDYYNGVDSNGDMAVWSYLAVSTARDPDNIQRYYRQRKVDDGKKPVIVGLKNVAFHGRSLLSKKGGSYSDMGVTSALANPSNRVERLENVLTQV